MGLHALNHVPSGYCFISTGVQLSQDVIAEKPCINICSNYSRKILAVSVMYCSICCAQQLLKIQ